MIKSRSLASFLLKNLPKPSLLHFSLSQSSFYFINNLAFKSFTTSQDPSKFNNNHSLSQNNSLSKNADLAKAINQNSSEEEDELEDIDLEADETKGKKMIKHAKREYSKYNSLFGYVMRRVIETCIVYSKSTVEERNSLINESRFYYIKERLDKLTAKEQEGFFDYVRQFDEFALARVLDKKQDEGFYEEPSQIPLEAIIKEQHKKANVARFIHMDEQYGPVMAELILSFLDEKNNDFKLFIQGSQEEVQIGVLKPAMNKAWRKNEKLHENLKDFKRKYIKLFKEIEKIILKDHNPRIKRKGDDEQETEQEDGDEMKEGLPKEKLVRKFDVLRVILFRVFQSCNIYLSAASERRETIDENSRFYYIHQELKSWSSEDLNKLWMYLDDLKNVSDETIAGKNYDPQGFDTREIPFQGEKPVRTKRLGSCNNMELFYIINHKQFGQTLKKLIWTFLEDGNRDLYYYLSGSVNEYEIGKLATKISRSKISIRKALGENIDQVRDQLKSFLENTDPTKFSRKNRSGKSRKKKIIK